MTTERKSNLIEMIADSNRLKLIVQSLRWCINFLDGICCLYVRMFSNRDKINAV